jgi:hypothetical protein
VHMDKYSGARFPVVQSGAIEFTTITL